MTTGLENSYENDDDADSIGSVDLGQQQLPTTGNDDNASVTSMMPYGRIAAGAANPPRIQEVVLQHHQTAAHLLEGTNIELRGDNHSGPCSTISMEEAAILCHRLNADPTLVSIRFDECSASCPAICSVIQAVGDSIFIQQVRFDDCSSLLEEASVREALQRNTSLTTLSMYFVGGDALSGMLEIMLSSSAENLTSLMLFECEMDEDWEHRLASGLRRNTRLTALRIVGPTNMVGSDRNSGKWTITEQESNEATTSTSIMRARVYEEERENEIRKEASTMELVEAIGQLSNLKVLLLSGFDFGESLQASLGSFLSNLHQLERLSFRHCGIDSMGCVSLACFLQHHPLLQRLDLSRNRNIGDDGVMAILPCRNSETLQELELNYVSLTDRGMEALGDALPSMSSLKTLSLVESTPTCCHTRQGIRHLLKGLSQNYSITTLSIWPDNDNLTLQFYLRANRAGRGKLLRQGTELLTGLWPLILEKTQRYGSDVLYSFLRESQSLFV
jgi:hypothetical protein